MSFGSLSISAFVVVLAFVLGACIGSFVNCASLRRGTGESVLRGRSHCPECGKQLSAFELVPVISWLVQKGACRHCKKPLSLRYPATEIVLGLVFALLVWRYGVTAQFVELVAFASVLLYCSLVDLDSWTIPNAAIVAAIAIRVAYIAVAGLAFEGDAVSLLLHSLIGGFAIGIPLLIVVLVADRVLGRDSMGGGDLKLFFVAGLYFGWQQCLFLVIVACVVGIVMAFVAGGGDSNVDEDDASVRHRQIPFGPAIAVACVFTMLFGADLVGWYDSLFV